MREEGQSFSKYKRSRERDSPPCGGYANAVGPHGRHSRIKTDCGRWDCPECRKVLTDRWMGRIKNDLRGAILYTVRTKRHEGDLSSRIRRNIKKEANYYCAHLIDEALIFSNARFNGSEPKNRNKFLKEIEAMMESGEVTSMSRRHEIKKGDSAPRREPWSFAFITDEIMPEYRKCKSDYQIGLLLRKYRGTSKIRRLHNLGRELLRKIERGEINAGTSNSE